MFEKKTLPKSFKIYWIFFYILSKMNSRIKLSKLMKKEYIRGSCGIFIGGYPLPIQATWTSHILRKLSSQSPSFGILSNMKWAFASKWFSSKSTWFEDHRRLLS